METILSKDECWAAFWSVIGPALVELHTDGKIPAEGAPAA